MKYALAFCLVLVSACGTPTAPSTSAHPASLTREPSACVDGGGCPYGEACSTEGWCGNICGDPTIPGDTVVCPIGEYCMKRRGTGTGGSGSGLPQYDCVPPCLFSDGGCL